MERDQSYRLRAGGSTGMCRRTGRTGSKWRFIPWIYGEKPDDLPMTPDEIAPVLAAMEKVQRPLL